MGSLHPNPKGFGYEHPRRGGSDEWYTPPEVFDALGLTFDLDPASPGLDRCHVPARACYTQADDGLRKPWQGLVWLNPPYGGKVGMWLRRLARHGNGVALVCPRVDTAWWQDYAAKADVVCFHSGRLVFYRDRDHVAGGTSTISNALLGYGPVAARAVARCGLGMVLYSPGGEQMVNEMEGDVGQRERRAEHEKQQNGQADPEQTEPPHETMVP